MKTIDFKVFEKKLSPVASENGFKLGKLVNPFSADESISLEVRSKDGWTGVPVASVKYSFDYSRLIVEELPRALVAKEHKENYPASLAEYSPKIRAVAQFLEQDPDLKAEVILVTRYS